MTSISTGVYALVCPNIEALIHIKHNEANLNLMDFGFHTAYRTHTYNAFTRTHVHGLFFPPDLVCA